MPYDGRFARREPWEMGLKRVLLAVVLSIPLLACAGSWILVVAGKYRTSGYLGEADGLHWSVSGTELRARVQRRRERWREAVTVTIVDSAGKPRYLRELFIPRGLGAEGFLAAMQVDDDPEPEIAFVARGSVPYFYIDVSAAGIQERYFRTASQATRDRISEWMAYHVLAPPALVLWLVVLLAFYALLLPRFLAGMGLSSGRI